MELVKSIDQPGQLFKECAKQIIVANPGCDVAFASLETKTWTINTIYSLEFSDIEVEERKVNINITKIIELDNIIELTGRKYISISIVDVNELLLPKGAQLKIIVLNRNENQTKVNMPEVAPYLGIAMLKLAAIKTSTLHSEFLANMSHKIRTPLTNIMHSIHSLREMRLSGPQEELVSSTYSGALELATVINDIIDLTKLQNKKLILKSERFCLELWINETLEPFKAEAHLKGIDLKIFIDDNVPRFIVTDPKRLSQILVKLIDNSIKYTPISSISSPIVLQISADSNFTGKTLEYNITFKVTDHGIGIPDQIQQLINQPSTPGADEHERLSKIGFGIAVAKKLLELFGGKLSCQTIPPNPTMPTTATSATTFTFNIVVDGLDSNKVDLDSFKHIRGKNILVVDHDPKRGLEIALNLKRWGITTTLCRTSEEVVLLQLENIGKVDLVIIDDQIKIKGAVQLAQKIKELNPKINLICISNVEISDHPIFDRTVVLPLEMPNLMTIILDLFVSKQGLSNYRGAHLPYINYNILIVDDEPNNQIVLDRMLRYFGYNNIIFKNNGKDALDYITESLQQPEQSQQSQLQLDIIFTDIKMPLVNGIEFTKKLRELIERQKQQEKQEKDKIEKQSFNPAIIGVSAQPELDDYNPNIFDAFVAKPIERAELSKAILSIV